jgi:hypothetical protein
LALLESLLLHLQVSCLEPASLVVSGVVLALVQVWPSAGQPSPTVADALSPSLHWLKARVLALSLLSHVW